MKNMCAVFSLMDQKNGIGVIEVYRPAICATYKGLYQRNGFVFKSIAAKRTIMDSAVTAQLGFGGYKDPVTLSSEFKKYGWEVTGSPKSSRAVGWQMMKSLLWQAGSDQPGLFISERCERVYGSQHCLIASVTIRTRRI